MKATISKILIGASLLCATALASCAGLETGPATGSVWIGTSVATPSYPAYPYFGYNNPWNPGGWWNAGLNIPISRPPRPVRPAPGGPGNQPNPWGPGIDNRPSAPVGPGPGAILPGMPGNSPNRPMGSLSARH